MTEIRQLASSAMQELSKTYGTPGKRRVVCAAILFDGHLVVGPRHGDEVMRRQLDLLPSRTMRGHQGFIDQWGVFMDRKEAHVVAAAAKQINRKHPPYDELLSEDLY